MWSFLSRWGSNPDPSPTADATRWLTFLSVVSEHCSHGLYVPSRAIKHQLSWEQLRIHFSNFQNNHNTLKSFFFTFFSSQWKLWINSMLYPWPPSPPPVPPSPLCGFPTAYAFLFRFISKFLFVLFFFPRVLRRVGGEGGCCYEDPSANGQLGEFTCMSALCLRCAWGWLITLTKESAALSHVICRVTEKIQITCVVFVSSHVLLQTYKKESKQVCNELMFQPSFHINLYFVP